MLCDPRDCNSNGLCLGTKDKFTCACHLGYSGERCETSGNSSKRQEPLKAEVMNFQFQYPVPCAKRLIVTQLVYVSAQRSSSPVYVTLDTQVIGVRIEWVGERNLFLIVVFELSCSTIIAAMRNHGNKKGNVVGVDQAVFAGELFKIWLLQLGIVDELNWYGSPCMNRGPIVFANKYSILRTDPA